MENTAQNNLLEKRPLDLSLNFGASPHLKDISFMKTILWSRYWLARYWSGWGCRRCVEFDWKVWGKSELSELGIDALGTLWENRFHGTPAANKTTLAKKPRGSFDFATARKNLVVSWLGDLLLVVTTMFPVILSAQLNGGQCQSRKKCITNGKTFRGLQQENGWCYSVQSVYVYIWSFH